MPLDEKEKILFLQAAERNNLTAVKYYVEEEGASLFTMNDEQETLVHISARNGYTDLLKYVLKKEPSIVADKDRYGNTAFFLANQMGAVDIIRYLVEEHGAAIARDKARKFLSSAMHTAAQFGHLDTLKYFIEEKGNDVNMLNDRRESLLYAAVEYKHHDIVKYLVEKQRADVNLLNMNHANVIFPTVATNDLSLMKYFFDERKVSIDINWQDKFGNTLAHRAAFMNRTNIMKYLVDEKHADINIAGNEKMTPLHYAASRNCHEICKFLIEHGADVWSKDDKGQTPIEKTFDKSLIEYMRNVTSTTRNRRSVHPTDSSSSPILEYNLQPLLLIGSLSPVGNLETSAQSVFSDFYSSRLQDFLAIANLVVRNTWRLSGKNKSDMFSSPSNILREKIDPVAFDAVTSVYCFEEE